MTQDELVMWVEVHGCSITHRKARYYRVIGPNGKPMGIPEPREGETDLLPMTVCRICHSLDIPIPDCAQEAFETYTKIQKTHHGKEL